ncbi:hypothetical protein AWB74_07908 [Caballeronia arvi]|uniref:Uncharacterized protein n=1 Tax=Caballeronia arvi TaxID=1777135 RepID=A0A158L0P3_9BURK|nr:hypothetical protein [Caballeronia arvi]SAL86944.1 hypothetical protein AWB74_07908 [Caballeronia arvi]
MPALPDDRFHRLTIVQRSIGIDTRDGTQRPDARILTVLVRGAVVHAVTGNQGMNYDTFSSVEGDPGIGVTET